MAESKSKNQNENRDGLALIIGGLLVLSLVFGAYSYFNKKATDMDVLSTADDRTEVTNSNEEMTESDTEKASETKGIGDRIKEFFGMDNKDETDSTTMEGDLNGKGTSTSKSDDTDKMMDTATGTGGQGEWSATDYKQGDISSANYTVKAGDTLWEIAEARYGNGADWTMILQANSASIGYLPNGQQALIQVGQVLVLPN